MITVRELPSLRQLIDDARSSGKSIGLVPTMGALHEGHLALLRLAKRECGFVVVSIFVNPLQFAPDEDFQRYPRRPDEDTDMLRRERADLLYRPDEAELFPDGFSTAVAV